MNVCALTVKVEAIPVFVKGVDINFVVIFKSAYLIVIFSGTASDVKRIVYTCDDALISELGCGGGCNKGPGSGGGGGLGRRCGTKGCKHLGIHRLLNGGSVVVVRNVLKTLYMSIAYTASFTYTVALVAQGQVKRESHCKE